MVIFLTLSSATTSPSVLETSPFILRCSYLTTWPGSSRPPTPSYMATPTPRTSTKVTWRAETRSLSFLSEDARSRPPVSSSRQPPGLKQYVWKIMLRNPTNNKTKQTNSASILINCLISRGCDLSEWFNWSGWSRWSKWSSWSRWSMWSRWSRLSRWSSSSGCSKLLIIWEPLCDETKTLTEFKTKTLFSNTKFFEPATETFFRG